MNQKGNFIESVHLLRGVAALMVVVYHLIGWFPLGVIDTIHASAGDYGRMGVAVFFVISGFVLPLSLGSESRLAKFPRFMLRRFIRIEPTFIVSLIVSSIIFAVKTRLAPNGIPWVPELGQIASHFLYLIPFTEWDWVNVVYWTLAIEFQYYLVIGLSFPLIQRFVAAQPRFGPIITIAAMAFLVYLAPLVPPLEFFAFAPYFALGLTAYFLYKGQLPLAPAILLSFGCLFLGLGHGLTLSHLLVSVGSVFLIALWKAPRLPLRWLGTISYSLYIIHYPIVEFVSQAAAAKLPGSPILYAIPFLNIALSLAAAWLLYRLVEKPTQAFSRKLRSR